MPPGRHARARLQGRREPGGVARPAPGSAEPAAAEAKRTERPLPAFEGTTLAASASPSRPSWASACSSSCSTRKWRTPETGAKALAALTRIQGSENFAILGIAARERPADAGGLRPRAGYRLPGDRRSLGDHRPQAGRAGARGADRSRRPGRHSLRPRTVPQGRPGPRRRHRILRPFGAAPARYRRSGRDRARGTPDRPCLHGPAARWRRALRAGVPSRQAR